MVGSWFTQGRLVCRCSHSLRVVPLSLVIKFLLQQWRAFGGLSMVSGLLFKAVILEGWKTFRGTECKCCWAGSAARTMAGIELCLRKPALVSQLSTCHCYCQREGDERNRLQQQKIQFIKNKKTPTKQQQNNPGELPVLNVLSNLAWRKKCDM